MREGGDWLSLLSGGICGSAPQRQVAILPAIIRSSFSPDGQGGRSGRNARWRAGWRQADFAVTGGQSWRRMAHQS